MKRAIKLTALAAVLMLTAFAALSMTGCDSGSSSTGEPKLPTPTLRLDTTTFSEPYLNWTRNDAATAYEAQIGSQTMGISGYNSDETRCFVQAESVIRSFDIDESGVYNVKVRLVGDGVANLTSAWSNGVDVSYSGGDDSNLLAYYVSSTGNDSTATGSIDAPYKSINTALAAAEPGYTIILRGGTYREGRNVRVQKQNITIKSRGGEWAVIDLTTPDPGYDDHSGVNFYVGSSGGKLQRVEVKGGFYAVCMETKWDWGDPADRAGASYIIIENCVLHDSKYDVIKIKPNCDYITIRNNEIYNSGQAFPDRPPTGEANAEGIDNVNGDNMTVRNNYIHDICSNAVYAKGGASDALIENNRIERAYGGGILVGFDTSPEFFDLTVNPQYYENIRGVVRNNLIVGTGWEGIGLYSSKDAEVCNNTLVNVTNGGRYHSAIYFGLTYQDWEDYAGRPASVNPNIHHNIVSQPSSNVLPMIEIRYSNDLGGMSALSGNPTMNNNCYYIAGKSAVFVDNRPDRKLEKAGFSAWQSHISGDSGSLEADPVLNTAYKPSNSQCAGMGANIDLIPQR